MSQIITLTTDFGTRDFYAASLKGALWSECPNVNIVEVTHHVSPFNIHEAAFILRNTYQRYPQGTIHIVSVSDNNDADCRYLALKHRDQYFLGSDNGLFSLVFDEEPELAYEPNLFREDNSGKTYDELMAAMSGYICNGGEFAEIGRPVYEIRRMTNLEPVTQENLVRGTIIYVDRFENVITNVRRELFDRMREGKRFVVQFKRNERVTEISNRYYDVPEGEKLCIFNEAGYLEIAINKGKAASLLGLKVGDYLQIEFV